MLKVYNLKESEQWDAIVRSFKKYDVYWLSGYVEAFHIHGDGEPILFYYEDELTRGINVVMKRDISKDARFSESLPPNQLFDFATPYGYGGWIIEGEDAQNLFREYERWIEKNNIVSEFVRFHPIVKNHIKTSSFYEIVQLGEVVHMDLASPELIWNNITSKNRNMIRKAIKNDVKVYNGRFPEIYKQFQVIYNETMGRDDADAYYYFEEKFYESILDKLPQNAQIFWAEKDDKIIAASIIAGANGHLNYHLSGSLREYGHMAPGNLILYSAALWGCANGYTTFYLGGGVGSEEDNLFKFKRSFYKGELNNFFIGKKIHNSKKYEELLKARKEDVSREFFPEYRG